MSKAIKKSRDIGPYIIDEKWLGELNENTVGIVVENSLDREKFKPRVKVMRTENIDLLAGHNTVAIFRIKKNRPVVEEAIVVTPAEINVTDALANMYHKMKSKSSPVIQMGVR